jgi:hypothetical protein
MTGMTGVTASDEEGAVVERVGRDAVGADAEGDIGMAPEAAEAASAVIASDMETSPEVVVTDGTFRLTPSIGTAPD